MSYDPKQLQTTSGIIQTYEWLLANRPRASLKARQAWQIRLTQLRRRQGQLNRRNRRWQGDRQPEEV